MILHRMVSRLPGPQFYAQDPLIPPNIFYNRTFCVTVVASALMSLVRNSVTYNMIFHLQVHLYKRVWGGGGVASTCSVLTVLNPFLPMIRGPRVATRCRRA